MANHCSENWRDRWAIQRITASEKQKLLELDELVP